MFNTDDGSFYPGMYGRNKFTAGGITFKNSVKNPKSYLAQLVWLLDVVHLDGLTKTEFYLFVNPSAIDPDTHKVRRGWSTSGTWGAFVRAGILSRTRDRIGTEWIYDVGPNFIQYADKVWRNCQSEMEKLYGGTLYRLTY